MCVCVRLAVVPFLWEHSSIARGSMADHTSKARATRVEILCMCVPMLWGFVEAAALPALRRDYKSFIAAWRA